MKHLIQILISWGPAGLLLLGALDSAGVPIIGGVDALLIAIAVLEPGQAYVAAICAIIGSLTGSLILFAIARKGGEVLLAKYIAHGPGARLHRWFERYGLVTVFIPAISPIPMPMKIPVFCAGALEVRWSYFISVVLSARVLRYFALAYLGKQYGHQTIPFLRSHWEWVTAIILFLAAVAIVALRYVNRNRFPSKLESALQ